MKSHLGSTEVYSPTGSGGRSLEVLAQTHEGVSVVSDNRVLLFGWTIETSKEYADILEFSDLGKVDTELGDGTTPSCLRCFKLWILMNLKILSDGMTWIT